jgi:hypothetical protein
MPLHPFEFRGYDGTRRVRSFEWRYDFESSGRSRPQMTLPQFLLPLRETAARFARLEPA